MRDITMRVSIVFKYIVLLSGLGALQIAAACDFPPKELTQKPRSEFRGPYTNNAYGYFTVIPHGFTGYSEAPPGPLHGFGLIVGEAPQSYINVSGEANSLGYESASEAAAKL